MQMGVAVGDLNGDGSNDVAVAVPGGVEVFLQSNGSLGTPTLVAQPGAQFVKIADVDGDGRKDLVVSADYGGTTTDEDGIFFIRNTGTGWAAAQAVTRNARGQIAVADVNGDGRLDVVAANVSYFSNGQFYVYPQLAGGTWGAEQQVA